MTAASELALTGLKDLSTVQWYVIPFLAIVFSIYTTKIEKARESGNWDAVFAGLALFGTDFLFETINGWIFQVTRYSALWTTPGQLHHIHPRARGSYRSFGMRMISMRRFCARPSRVSLSATGRYSLYPAPLRNLGSTPSSTRIFTTDMARAVESSQLLG